MVNVATCYWVLGFKYATLKEVRNHHLMEEAERTQDAATPPSPVAIEPSKRHSTTEHESTADGSKEKKPAHENQMMNPIDMAIEEKTLGEPGCKQLP